jgi:UDP-2,3-diacylglucosamine pyrophosphatase LpxH
LILVALLAAAAPTRAERIQTIHTPQLHKTRPKLFKPRPWAARLGRRVLAGLPRRLRHVLLRRRADLVVVSDLHLGQGRTGGRYGPLEDFTEDRAFVQFVHYLVRRQRRARRPLKLVLAGDTLDFLKVPSGPSSIEDSDTRPTAHIAVAKFKKILHGHRRFFDALRLLVKEGHEVTVVAGNHDQELNFDQVQARFRDALAPGRAGRRRVRFRRWFEVHGTALIEHGQRYEPMTSLAGMLYPLERRRDGQLSLRSSAANYLVAEMLNRIKHNIPHLNYIPSGRQIFLEVARRRPQEAVKLVSFADRIAKRMRLKDPVKEREILEQHNQVLRTIGSSRSLRHAINRSRRALGLSKLSTERTYALLRRFDNLAAPPHLERPELKGGFLRRVLRMFRPEEMEKWFNPSEGSTNLEGQAFALAHLASIVVNGHTHSPGHAVMRRAGGGLSHLLDAGTWTPVTLKEGSVRPPMTFVDVRQTFGQPTARLRRWDVGLRRPVTLPPARLDASEFLSE